ncbi:dihydrodipicolinate synthase family protein, partial [Streptomyces sp. NPDC049577]|uniref:dihydrodipicolinate synthase family protein n=1 Tax=Streptomyces sp. NPDC049577 TaxID=3155153 RepID=UPI0034325A9C
SIGAAGYVSTVANVAGPLMAAALDAYDRGDTAAATAAHQRSLPLTEAMMAAGLPGTVTAKALLGALGLPAGPVRAPLLAADNARTEALVAAYEAAVGPLSPVSLAS